MTVAAASHIVAVTANNSNDGNHQRWIIAAAAAGGLAAAAALWIGCTSHRHRVTAAAPGRDDEASLSRHTATAAPTVAVQEPIRTAHVASPQTEHHDGVARPHTTLGSSSDATPTATKTTTCCDDPAATPPADDCHSPVTFVNLPTKAALSTKARRNPTRAAPLSPNAKRNVDMAAADSSDYDDAGETTQAPLGKYNSGWLMVTR